MADFGGLIRFTYDGNSLTIRAKLDIEPGDFAYSLEHNQDGSFDRYVAPMGPTIETDFVDSVDGDSAISQPWNAIMQGGPYNIAVLEDSTQVTHTITNGKFVGRPKIDREKGLVTGISIQGRVGSYKQLTA